MISSNCSSIPEVAKDAGLLLDPLKGDQWPTAIGELLKDKDRWEKMRKRGLELAAAMTWRQAAETTLELIT